MCAKLRSTLRMVTWTSASGARVRLGLRLHCPHFDHRSSSSGHEEREINDDDDDGDGEGHDGDGDDGNDDD